MQLRTLSSVFKHEEGVLGLHTHDNIFYVVEDINLEERELELIPVTEKEYKKSAVGASGQKIALALAYLDDPHAELHAYCPVSQKYFVFTGMCCANHMVITEGERNACAECGKGFVTTNPQSHLCHHCYEMALMELHRIDPTDY